MVRIDSRHAAQSESETMSDKTQATDETASKGFRQDGQGDKAGDKGLPENSREEKDERLDEALEETFPSSDPVSVKITK